MIKNRIREHLRTMHTDADLQTWFDPLFLRFSDASGLEVLFPHALFAEWFTLEHRQGFEEAVRGLFGPQTPIVYKNQSLRPNKPKKTVFALQPGVLPPPPAEAVGQCSFETFMHNRKNEFPVSMAKEVASTPKNPAYNPFVICGKGTCGKTHLLRAIARTMAKTLRWDDIFFGTVHDLAGVGRDNGGVRKALAHSMAVCIDNAQHLADQPDLQQDIMYIADLFREKKRPLVLALDEGPAQAGLHEKLRSRLESGLVVSLKKPDLEIRLRYAKAQAEQQRLQLKKEHLLKLVQRFQDFRHLEGIITKLAAYQDKTGQAISQGDLDKILVHSDIVSGKPLTAEAIIDLVAEQFSLRRADIMTDSRKADIVQARQISMYLCRELLGVSLAALGSYFNGKNHATVLYACNKIKELQDSNKDTNILVSQLRKKCLSARA